MSISNVSLWMPNDPSAASGLYDPWQMCIATTVASIALPLLVKLAGHFRAKATQLPAPIVISKNEDPPPVIQETPLEQPFLAAAVEPQPPREVPQLFHTWKVEDREIRFLSCNQQVQFDVIRSSDSHHESHMGGDHY